ncbi:hypothetical protein INS90_04150 [Trueperella pecoris]|uniref:DUF6318 domain-containing protein n=1 Tax=Trueperella pecoris TaxID=2733571 RepID=A0A7M1R4S2_9ACTO|nr:DUF6318 family protein [Trueperella pecoris]QOR48465.1 hypothetical protein INS90_04150 [Trueperella pecoris]
MAHEYRHFGFTAGVLAAYLTLAGCTTGEPSQPTESSTSAAASTTPQTHTIPPRPRLQAPAEPELTGVDIDNAYALAKYYFELYKYVKTTGDTATWEKYAHPECKYCQKVLNAAINDNKTGAWSETKLGILDTATFYSTGDVDYRIDFLIERGEMVYHGANKDTTLQPGRNTLVVGIKQNGQSLLIRSFDIIGSSYFGQEELP